MSRPKTSSPVFEADSRAPGVGPPESGHGVIGDLRQELDFGTFIAERATQFINVPADRVDDAILEMERALVLAFGFDRCTVLEIWDETDVSSVVSWTRPGLPTPPLGGNLVQLFPSTVKKILGGATVRFSSLDEVDHEADRTTWESFGVKSALVVPLMVGGTVVGSVSFATMRTRHTWSDEIMARARLVASVLGTVLARRKADRLLEAALSEVARLRDQLHSQNAYLRSEVRELRGDPKIKVQSPLFQSVLHKAEQVATTDSSVLLIGETGTGKEMLAEMIHDQSRRHAHPMVRVNCAALPASLLESELFGREKGAYTGAHSTQPGRFELANGSTFFLDEIGDLPMEAQVKLLRVLEQRQVERLGSSKPIRIDTRVIAATHRDLEQLVAEGAFRKDLFYRLNVFPIRVPPLRERPQDIPSLVWHFVSEFSASFRKQITSIPQDNMRALVRYAWPGNVRELRNVVERAMILAAGPELTVAVPAAAQPASRTGTALADFEREHIRRVLEGAGWRIRGQGGAAEQLGLKPTTLETRMAKLGLSRPV